MGSSEYTFEISSCKRSPLAINDIPKRITLATTIVEQIPIIPFLYRFALIQYVPCHKKAPTTAPSVLEIMSSISKKRPIKICRISMKAENATAIIIDLNNRCFLKCNTKGNKKPKGTNIKKFNNTI